MRYLISESTYILCIFPTLSNVTIDIIRLSDDEKIIDAVTMAEIITKPGYYKYLFTPLPAPILKEEYLWEVTDGLTTRSGKLVLGGYPNLIVASQTAEEESIGNIEDDISTIQSDINVMRAGPGSIAWSYTITNEETGMPIADAEVWATSDLTGLNTIESGRTDQNGVYIFHLDAGPVYIWRSKSGFNFVNPDIEVVG